MISMLQITNCMVYEFPFSFCVLGSVAVCSAHKECCSVDNLAVPTIALGGGSLNIGKNYSDFLDPERVQTHFLQVSSL